MDLRLCTVCQCQTPAFMALEMSAFEVRSMFQFPIAQGIQWYHQLCHARLVSMKYKMKEILSSMYDAIAYAVALSWH